MRFTKTSAKGKGVAPIVWVCVGVCVCVCVFFFFFFRRPPPKAWSGNFRSLLKAILELPQGPKILEVLEGSPV